MLVNRYYVIYAEVASGYPGVELVEIPFGETERLREDFRKQYGYAVLDILEVK